MGNELVKGGCFDVEVEGVRHRCVMRATPFERYFQAAADFLREFQDAGFAISGMDSRQVVTVKRTFLLQCLNEVNQLPHVYGLSRQLTPSELTELIGFIQGLKEQEVYLSQDVQEVDPDEIVCANVGGVCLPVRLRDILGMTRSIK